MGCLPELMAPRVMTLDELGEKAVLFARTSRRAIP